MPRANRHHIPGQIWHITHRCHQRAFLFRFARDRNCWIQWLFEAMDNQCEHRFVEKMKALAYGLSKKGCTKNYDKVVLRIGRLKQKYARVAQYYDIGLVKAEKGSNAVSLRFERINHEAKKYAGVYCLRTNIPDWDDEQLWRPVYHQKTARVEGHLWITLLAYHLAHYIQ